jgi:hypothetical protein
MWAWRRRALVMAYMLLFALVAFYVGPKLITNVLLYGHITGLQKEQLERAIVHSRRVTLFLQAVRYFERDHGRLPQVATELHPDYYTRTFVGHEVLGRTYSHSVPIYEHKITYEFAPDIEGWYVSGPKFNGRFDMPLVPKLTTNAVTTNSESP